MTILGITNRTENWKTARHFGPLFGSNSVRLARRLLPGEERAGLQPGDVRLELFWYGMRDHFHSEGKKRKGEEQALAEAYSASFGTLRDDVKSYGKFRRLQPYNYEVSESTSRSKLATNLLNTEIDIVLETPNRLLIGEAKHKSDFGANGNDVLVHQLIRQYVMAKILLDLCEDSRKIVPFVIGDDRADLLKKH